MIEPAVANINKNPDPDPALFGIEREERYDAR